MSGLSKQECRLAGDRAAHLRRRQAIVAGAESNQTLMEQISFMAIRHRTAIDPDWTIIGMVVDRLIDRELLVYYNSTTHGVKVETPDESVEPSKEFGQRNFPFAIAQRDAGEIPYFQYFFDGQEYSLEEAAILVRDSETGGWTREAK